MTGPRLLAAERIVNRLVNDPAERATVLDMLGLADSQQGRREDILQAGLRVADRVAPITMRAVARELGVTAKVVERHFRTAEVIEAALAVRVLTQILNAMAAAAGPAEVWEVYRELAIGRPGWHALLLTSKDVLAVLFAFLDELVLGAESDRSVARGHLALAGSGYTAGPAAEERRGPGRVSPGVPRQSGPAVRVLPGGAW